MLDEFECWEILDDLSLTCDCSEALLDAIRSFGWEKQKLSKAFVSYLKVCLYLPMYFSYKIARWSWKV